MSPNTTIGRLAGASRGLLRGIGRVLPFAVAVVLALTPRPGGAETLSSEAAPTVTLHVPLGKAAPLTVPEDVETVIVSQPETAKVDVAGPRDLFVLGRDIGSTNLLVYGPDARLLEIVNVDVGYDARQLSDDLAAALPAEPIQVRDLGQGLLLTGRVSSSEAAATAQALADRAAPDAVVSHLDVTPSQVRLEVRMIETSTARLRDIGLRLDASDGSHVMARVGSGGAGPETPISSVRLHGGSGRYDLDTSLDTLQQRGSLHVLARPSLAALSGELAGFQAGGELPYPVPQGKDKVTIQYHPYGTSLTFQPDVQANGFIRLRLAAEVSTIDPTVGLRLNGVNVPGFTARRVAATADLRDGETLIFAGLLQDETATQAKRTPWLSRLGDLVGAHRSKGSRRELAILVTPHLVKTDEPPALSPELAEAARPDDPAPKQPDSPRLPHPRAVVAELRSLMHDGADLTRRGWRAVTGVTRRVLAALAPKAPPAAAGGATPAAGG